MPLMPRFPRLPLLAVVCLSLATTACKKDTTTPAATGLQVQAHDQNAMMKIMHDMMNQMNAIVGTMDPDNDYALMMKAHHTGAINMANKELAAGTDATIKAMAQRMITAQQAEITQFNAFLAAHQAQAPMVMEFMDRAMKTMEVMDRNNDIRVLTGNADRDFAQLMIDHHTSAVDMSRDLLELGRENTTRTLARQIIADQQMEIKELQTWLLTNKGY